MNIHLPIGGGDHAHVPNLAIDDRIGQVEFGHHAEWNCSTAWFGVVELALENPRLDTGLGKHLGGTGPTGATAHHCDTQHQLNAPPKKLWCETNTAAWSGGGIGGFAKAIVICRRQPPAQVDAIACTKKAESWCKYDEAVTI